VTVNYWPAPVSRGRHVASCLTGLFLSLFLAASAGGADYTFLQETAEAPFNASYIIKAPKGWGKAETRIAFNYQDEHNYYYARLTADAVEVHKVKAGRDVHIGTKSMVRPSNLGKEIAITVQRRLWRIGVLCNGVHATEAFDDEFLDGKVGYAVSAKTLSVREGDPPIQPVGEIELDDSFVREGETGQWTPVQGKWQTGGLGGREKPELTANPFSYTAIGPETAISVAGYWFWDDYIFNAAAKGVGDGAIGLIVRYQDPDNFLLFRWVGTWGGGYSGREKQLIRVRNGKWAILKHAAGGFIPGQWYKLAVRVHGGVMECFIDGNLIFRGRDIDLRQGQVGLYAAGELSRAHFDDVQVRPIRGFMDDFSEPARGKWRVYSGTFGYNHGSLVGKAPNSTGYAVSGESDWDNMTIGADAQAHDGGIGLCFGWRDTRNYYLFRWGGPTGTSYAGKKQLIRVVDGDMQVLAQAGGGFKPDRRYRLKVEADRGYVAAFVDGQMVLQIAGAERTAGKVGLLADHSQHAAYTNVLAWFRERFEAEPTVVKQFVKEDTMKHWARPGSAWVPSDDVKGLYWHRSPFFSDHRLEVASPKIGSASGSLSLILAADGKDPESGYSLTLQMEQGAPKATLTLRRVGRVLAQLDVPASEDAGTVCLERRGGAILAFVNDRCVAASRDEHPLAGRRMGLRITGLPADFSNVHVHGSHLLDYTFTQAPTDWTGERGDWRVRTRWPCKPGWAWFGTSKNEKRKEAPIVWNKRLFEGDLTLEAFVALIMDLPEEPGYSSPSDLNCTICGDGRMLKSGYSFIYAGWNNTSTRMLRREQIVAQDDNVKFDNPVSMNLDFQRHWFYLRVDKIGDKVIYSVDGKPIFEYEDPNPLDAGKVALWTYNNGLTIARVRIAYEGGGRATPTAYPWPGPQEEKQDIPYILYGD